jgi:hypothetical protein
MYPFSSPIRRIIEIENKEMDIITTLILLELEKSATRLNQLLNVKIFYYPYGISFKGNVLNTNTGKIIRSSPTKRYNKVYHRVTIYINGKRKQFYIENLLKEYWLQVNAPP